MQHAIIQKITTFSKSSFHRKQYFGKVGLYNNWLKDKYLYQTKYKCIHKIGYETVFTTKKIEKKIKKMRENAAF